MTGILIKSRVIWTQTQGDGHVKTGVMLPKVKEFSEAREGTRTATFLKTSEGSWPCGYFDFRLPTFRTVRQYISVVSSSVCVPLYSFAALGNQYICNTGV